jgi:hypothetical protein
MTPAEISAMPYGAWRRHRAFADALLHIGEDGEG